MPKLRGIRERHVEIRRFPSGTRLVVPIDEDYFLYSLLVVPGPGFKPHDAHYEDDLPPYPMPQPGYEGEIAVAYSPPGAASDAETRTVFTAPVESLAESWYYLQQIDKGNVLREGIDLVGHLLAELAAQMGQPGPYADRVASNCADRLLTALRMARKELAVYRSELGRPGGLSLSPLNLAGGSRVDFIRRPRTGPSPERESHVELEATMFVTRDLPFATKS